MSNFIKTTPFKIIVITAILVVILIVVLSNPLLWPTKFIQMRILILTPIGTSMEDVIKVIENNKKWRVLQNSGYEPWSTVSDAFIEDTKDRKTIVIQIGTYYTPFTTDVSVAWRFDDDLKLIKVEVSKSTEVF